MQSEAECSFHFLSYFTKCWIELIPDGIGDFRMINEGLVRPAGNIKYIKVNYFDIQTLSVSIFMKF